jgi:Kef-type K+ transport system membrane component KefB
MIETHYLSEQNILHFLIQVFLLLGLSRFLGEIFRGWKQPPLTAELLVGIVLGPTILGRLFPQLYLSIFPADQIQINMLETVAWLGVLFLLLESGLEIDFSSAWRQRADALKIAVIGIVVPLALIFFCVSVWLPDQYLIDPNRRMFFALFLATVLSITAIPTVTRALHDLSLSKTDLAILIMAALSINDVLGWLIFTVVMTLFMSGALDISHLGFELVFTFIFLATCLTVGRHWSEKFIHWMRLRQMPEPSSSLTFVSLLGIFCGIITQMIGIHALFGFLIAGVTVGGSTMLPEKTRHVISQMVYAIFVPLFFASIGLRIDFFAVFDLRLVLFITALSIGGKFLGAWLGSQMTKNSADNKLFIAIAHTPGGMMEVVVGILALENNLITEKIFAGIVASAIISSIIVGPWLSHSINRRKKIGLLEYFSFSSFISDLKATNREQAIVELCESVSNHENITEAQVLITEVLKREDVMGTAMEEGVALPHARLMNLRKPMIIFGRSFQGIDWNSLDGKPTRFVFLILTPERDNDIQIQLLRAIALVVSHENVREEIARATTREDLKQIFNKAFTAQLVVRRK